MAFMLSDKDCLNLEAKKIQKAQFRSLAKAKMCKKFCIYDKKCAQKILTSIQQHKKPKAYKIRNGITLAYRAAKQNTTAIACYMPMASEVDITPLLKWLRQHKKYEVFVPKLEKTSFNMVKYRLPFVRNHWHINEPKSSTISKNIIIDIAIVPALGVDKNMRRIGFGKGMYDRFYATLQVKPYSIMTSRMRQIATQEFCEWYDIQADQYVSTYK